ncbi:hypothetical protein OHA25_07165 [Nonomuraea sp. NBC_00507]
MRHWQPYIPSGPLLWVIETSCYEEFVLCAEDGEYFVRRRAADGSYDVR